MPPDPNAGPSDDFLVAGMLGGDWSALNKLIERYDRLVRYTILRGTRERCTQDPQWLESVASATWAGFVQSVQRHPNQRPKSVRAYLAAIARNQVVSALRGDTATDAATIPLDAASSTLITATLEEPIDTLSHLELLETLRICLSELADDDRTLAGQLTSITERRWQDAAAALGISESTLRSRWKRTLERLRVCMSRKTGLSLAPETSDDDS
jgi:RNA polymerase sigma factor (sigma-70 family)